MADNPQETLHFLLGGMDANIKKLVEASEKQAGRMTKLEERTTRLEGFATRIGVLTAGLGVAVPTTITVIFRKLGLL
jgi:hypothetical protein